MLQLTNVRKVYKTAGFEQMALDDVSMAFRDNEFVAILGPSGSGKTTLLNIIGGLDHYDSGDLIIDGVSTKRYRDRDWDTYRNNRIGFVFQSYNLIPHQTVLANVELALTLSGVSKAERRERALRALDEVGLTEHVRKKPNQLSGGQMQRVAVARALINDPEILLADEPTGALDSKTSVQIMDLLVRIANERLVVMVTHNPDLAEEYATRTVSLSDGNIVSDSNPLVLSEAPVNVVETVKHSGMSFLTAITLSFSNLMTKKGRTLMTSFAGSIGIIGIAAILALANGVNNYIKTVEEDTLSIYPLTINSTGFDLTSLLVMGSGAGSSDDEDAGAASAATDTSEERSVFEELADAASGQTEQDTSTSARETKMLTTMFNSVQNNDLKSLKTFLDGGGDGITQYVTQIQYSYDLVPQIYSSDTSNGVHQVNPDQSFAALGLGSGTSSNSLMSMGMSTDVFAELMNDPTMFIEQYNIVAGHLPEAPDELILVLNPLGGVSDFLLYTMGLRDPAELADMVERFSNEEDVEIPAGRMEVPYEDILGVTFKLVPAASYYEYDEEFSVWKDMRDNKAYMEDLVENGRTLHIVGILKPNPDADVTMLQPLLYYPDTLTAELIEEAADAEIIQQQLTDRRVDVFSGKTFEQLAAEDEEESMDLSSLFSIDESAMGDAFAFDTSALQMDASAFSGLSGGLSGLNIDPNSLSAGDMPTLDLTAILGGMNLDVSDIDQAALGQAMNAIVGGYMAWAPGNVVLPSPPTIDPLDPGFADAMAAYQQELQQAYVNGFMLYVQQPSVQAEIAAAVGSAVDINKVQQQLQASLGAYMQMAITQYMQAYMQVAMGAITAQITGAMTQAMSSLASTMETAMSFNPDAFMNAFQFDMTEEQLTSLIMSFMGSTAATADSNLHKLGYASFDNPSSISIFPIDFESKEQIISILDTYNDRMKTEGAEEKVVAYTDLVGTLMSSVTSIIDMISTMLIAFVTISLIVSSIMIGVITYISVLERKKEIGILRAMGASKGNIGSIFNAETLIVGFVAGILGIGITLLLCIPANFIVETLMGVPNIAILPWEPSLLLVAVSMALCFLAGLLPSGSASRKDPVEALRSE
ncbi:MAG: ABC transporter ATP-binding protein/permease [Coriobacteriales bacterium]|jgi:ABC-type lipoprotein export system ATPase subunit|nr:ABC transporter ATP-binding protein/permease [Coriobacteriales bacterium]